jgi:hypothetical protein
VLPAAVARKGWQFRSYDIGGEVIFTRGHWGFLHLSVAHKGLSFFLKIICGNNLVLVFAAASKFIWYYNNLIP